MADTDSALKTQMFMSESQRQNAMDLTNRISQGFQAAGEAVKFESQVSQAMVQSASNFKQLQVDEWYKKEQVAMEARRINLAEKQAIISNQNAKARIDVDNKRADALIETNKAREANRLKTEEYGKLEGEISAAAVPFETDLKVKEAQINISEAEKTKLKADRDKIAKTSVASMPLAQREARIKEIDLRIDQENENISKITAGLPDIISSMGPLKSALQLAQSKSVPIDTIRGMIVKKEDNKYIPSVSSIIENETKEFRVVPETIKETPKPVVYETTFNDVNEYFNEDDYDPSIGRAIFNRIPEAKRQDAVIKIKEERALTLANLAFDQAKPSENITKRLQKQSDILGDNFVNTVNMKIGSVFNGARKLAYEREVKRTGKDVDFASFGKENIEEQDYMMAAKSAVGLNQPVAEGENKPTPPGVSSTEGFKKGSSDLDAALSGKPTTPTPDAPPKDPMKRYFEMFGVDKTESILAGNNEERTQQAHAYKMYEDGVSSYSNETSYPENKLAEMLMKVDTATLGVKTSFAGGYETSSKEDKINRIKELLKDRTRAVKVLAEYDTRKKYGYATILPRDYLN